jgi:hypothetical protein
MVRVRLSAFILFVMRSQGVHQRPHRLSLFLTRVPFPEHYETLPTNFAANITAGH